MNDFERFIPISKVDEDQRMVYGWASTPDLDSQGEIVSVEGLAKALPDYMKFPAIREMHQPKAAGKTVKAETSDNGLFIGAKIVAEDAWKMVKEGVYRGFSIGGRVKQKLDNIIQDLVLTEISLVDVPANRGSVFTLVKRDGEKIIDFQRSDVPDFVREQHEMLNRYPNPFGKGVSELPKKDKVKEEVVESPVEVESPEVEETEAVAEVETEVVEETKEVEAEAPAEESTHVVDETPQKSDKAEDVSKRLEKLEQDVIPVIEPDEALTKIGVLSSQIVKVTNILDGLKERIEKIEKTAMPVKAKPSYLVEKTEDTSPDRTALQKRLSELESIRDHDLNRYQREGMADEAIQIHNQLKKL